MFHEKARSIPPFWVEEAIRHGMKDIIVKTEPYRQSETRAVLPMGPCVARDQVLALLPFYGGPQRPARGHISTLRSAPRCSPIARASVPGYYDAEMKYGITVASIGRGTLIEISADEFQQIKTARTNILVVLEIEEKFELLVENYSEYERDALDIIQKRMIRDDVNWATAMDDLLLMNRRLANVLMAGRLYTDQVLHALSQLYGAGSDVPQRIRDAFSREHDRALGFRVMEALRNYVQHQALPIGTVHYGPEKVESNGRELVRYTLRPELDLAALGNSSFKRAVLFELQQCKDQQSVTLFVREFVQGLSRVHQDIRQQVNVDPWKSKLKHVLNVGPDVFHSTFGLAAVARDDEGNHPEILEVFEDVVLRLNLLRNRYTYLNLLADWFISGEIV